MMSFDKLMNSKNFSLMRLPTYIELHYQSFKENWKRKDEATSRLCYLAWLLAYEHSSPILNQAKNDAHLVEFMLQQYVDHLGNKWTLTNLEIHFVENYKNEFLSWGMPHLSLDTQNEYRNWFMNSAHFERFFPYKSNPSTLVLESTTTTPRLNGVDIIGYPNDISGIGELTRSLIAAATSINLNINLVSMSKDITSHSYTTYDHLISKSPKYKIRIFAMTLQNIPPMLYNQGIDYFQNSYNILNAAWEFEQRTPCLNTAFVLLDEVWSLSKFVKPAFNNPENTPTYVLHCGVSELQKTKQNRKKWNLPENSFLFLCAFDFNSYMKRKNPELAVDAFIKAYAKDSQTALVIKCTNANKQSHEWTNLISQIKNHRNIYLINETLERKNFVELLSSVDAYVSLHRSEGFGYILAECMLMDVPVVCTGYSGNMDFCTSENSYLVDYDLIPVKAGDYIQCEGLYWAEPRLQSAVDQIKLVFKDPELRKRKTEKARKKIQNEFSTKAIAKELEANLLKACSSLHIDLQKLKRTTS